MSDEARAEERFDDPQKKIKPGPYEGARGVYDDIGRSGKAAYERLAEEARVNNALLALDKKRTDAAAGIVGKAGQRTISQRSENNLKNNLGKIQRQYDAYNKNVEYALGSLSIKEAADEASFAARRAADDKSMQLSKRRFDADYGLQKQQLDMYKSDSDFNKAYQLYLKRLIKKDKFKDITGIQVKSLPVRRVKPLVIQLKQTDASTESRDPNYTLINSVNPDSSVTKYLVSKKLIEDAGKVGVDVVDKSGHLRDERVLRRDIYGEGVKPAFVLEGSAGSGKLAKSPDYIKLAFSDSNGRSTSCYVKRDVYEFAKGRGVELDVNGTPKSNTQLMRDLFGIGYDGTADYTSLATNLEQGADKIIDMFGLVDYRIMRQYADYMKTADSSLGVQPLNEAVKTLERMVMHPDIYKGENDQDYLNTLNSQFDVVGNELTSVGIVWQGIEKSGNLYSYSSVLRSFVESALSTLPEGEVSKLPDVDTLCKNVAASIAGESTDAQAQMILGKLPETIIDMLKYDIDSTEDILRRDNGLMPAGLYEKLEHADMPAWYKTPEEWTEQAFTDTINTYMQHAYWQDKLGENYDEVWTEGMPAMESFIEQGRKAAKEKGYGISDDYAACYGILTNGIELMENNEDARKQAEGDARSIFGTAEPLAVENDKVSYMLDPVTGFISDLRIKSGITDSANDVTKAVNDTVGYMLWKKSSGEELTETERAFFEQYGMDEITALIDNRGKGDYYKLTDSSKDAMKSDMLKEANYALYDFSPEELDFLKSASIETLNMSIQNEELNKEPDKQWLSALRLYRYYKNDLGIEVTGDYEADRTAAKKIFVDNLCNLTGAMDFESILMAYASANNSSSTGLTPEIEAKNPDNIQEANRILKEAPPELFMNTAEETEETYRTGGFIAGIRSGLTLGLAALVPENVADPEEFKRLALLGNPVGGTEFYKCGRFYSPAIAQEDARMAQNNPWAYWIGNIVGGLPYGFAAGALTKAASLPVRLVINAVPSAIQGGADAAAQGGDAFDIIFGALSEGTKGAISGGISDIAEKGLGTLLSKAPGLLKKVVPAVAGAGTEALTNTALGLGEDLILGRETDWGQVFSNLSSDFISSLITKGWHTDDDADTTPKLKGDSPAEPGSLPDVNNPVDIDTKVIDPVSGADITIPKGKSLADVNFETANFYDAAVKKIIGTENVQIDDISLPKTKADTGVGRAIDAYTDLITLPKEVLPDVNLKSLTDAYRVYEANSTPENASKFIKTVDENIGVVSGNGKSIQGFDTDIADTVARLEDQRGEIKARIDGEEGEEDNNSVFGSSTEKIKEISNGNIEKYIIGKKSFEEVLDDYSNIYSVKVNSNNAWRWDKDIYGGQNLTRAQKDKIKARAIENGYIPNIKTRYIDGIPIADFRGAGVVKKTIQLPEEKWLNRDEKQFQWLDKQLGSSTQGYTWHHSEIPGQMELIPFGIHNITYHNGGRSPGMWADAPR